MITLSMTQAENDMVTIGILMKHVVIMGWNIILYIIAGLVRSALCKTLSMACVVVVELCFIGTHQCLSNGMGI